MNGNNIRANGRRNETHSIGSIFGSYVSNCRTVPGVRQFTSKEKEAQKVIMDELSAYFEEA